MSGWGRANMCCPPLDPECHMCLHICQKLSVFHSCNHVFVSFCQLNSGQAVVMATHVPLDYRGCLWSEGISTAWWSLWLLGATDMTPMRYIKGKSDRGESGSRGVKGSRIPALRQHTPLGLRGHEHCPASKFTKPAWTISIEWVFPMITFRVFPNTSQPVALG